LSATVAKMIWPAMKVMLPVCAWFNMVRQQHVQFVHAHLGPQMLYNLLSPSQSQFGLRTIFGGGCAKCGWNCDTLAQIHPCRVIISRMRLLIKKNQSRTN
jgi:hypothetical protein